MAAIRKGLERFAWLQVALMACILLAITAIVSCNSDSAGEKDSDIDGDDGIIDGDDNSIDGDENSETPSCNCPAGYICKEDGRCEGVPPVEGGGSGEDGGDAVDGDGWYPDGDAPVDGDSEGTNSDPLKAGEWDDNANFDDFLVFMQEHSQINGVRYVDVSARLEVIVTDADGLPVPNAKVTVSMGQSEISVTLTTYADGSLYFHPFAYGIPEGAELAFHVDSPVGTADFTGGVDRTDPFMVELTGQRELHSDIPVDIAITLDTTGSMSDQIHQVQDTLIRIVERLQDHPAIPHLRFALVVYRDRGDSYVTTRYDFIDDIEAFNDLLVQIKANGGGDTPESVNEALKRTFRDLSWNESAAVRLNFLIGDAPPHMDYQEEYEYDDAMYDAAIRGIKVLPIAASGVDDLWETVCRQLAQFTRSRYVFLTAGGYNPHVDGDIEDGDTDQDNLPYDIGSLDDIMVNAVYRELDSLNLQ
jgi:hypothetical protein